MVKAQSARKRRGSNTKGRKIQHVDPLQRGQACDICRQRRVRCSGDEPCTACLRTAKVKKRLHRCSYTRPTTPPPPSASSSTAHSAVAVVDAASADGHSIVVRSSPERSRKPVQIMPNSAAELHTIPAASSSSAPTRNHAQALELPTLFTEKADALAQETSLNDTNASDNDKTPGQVVASGGMFRGASVSANATLGSDTSIGYSPTHLDRVEDPNQGRLSSVLKRVPDVQQAMPVVLPSTPEQLQAPLALVEHRPPVLSNPWMASLPFVDKGATFLAPNDLIEFSPGQSMAPEPYDDMSSLFFPALDDASKDHGSFSVSSGPMMDFSRPEVFSRDSSSTDTSAGSGGASSFSSVADSVRSDVFTQPIASSTAPDYSRMETSSNQWLHDAQMTTTPELLPPLPLPLGSKFSFQPQHGALAQQPGVQQEQALSLHQQQHDLHLIAAAEASFDLNLEPRPRRLSFRHSLDPVVQG